MAAVNRKMNPHLRCPFCGSRLTVEIEVRGSGYMQYDAPSAIACHDDNYRPGETHPCSAAWDTHGDLIQEPGRPS